MEKCTFWQQSLFRIEICRLFFVSLKLGFFSCRICWARDVKSRHKHDPSLCHISLRFYRSVWVTSGQISPFPTKKMKSHKLGKALLDLILQRDIQQWFSIHTRLENVYCFIELIQVSKMSKISVSCNPKEVTFRVKRYVVDTEQKKSTHYPIKKVPSDRSLSHGELWCVCHLLFPLS